jgi:hypothetical protein
MSFVGPVLIKKNEVYNIRNGQTFTYGMPFKQRLTVTMHCYQVAHTWGE